MFPDRPRHPSQLSPPPQDRRTTLLAAESLPEPNKTAMTNLLNAVADDDFWIAPRKIQVVGLVLRREEFHVSQTDIAKVMGVANSSVTRYKQEYEDHPDDMFPRAGRPSPISDVFPDIRNFIAAEMADNHAVTIGVLMEYVKDSLGVDVLRKNLREYMKSHGYAYVSGRPMEDTRVLLDRDKLVRYYNVKLPAAVDGVHPSLVFNMDEMGAERFADRKHVMVFLPDDENAHDGVAVGIPRSTRRCTLVACIALDGSRLKPAIITKTRRVNSAVYENGYDTGNLIVYSTKTSFITSDVFGRWLRDIFIPYVEETRRSLHERLGEFDDRAVLVLDKCAAHTNPAHRQLLAEKNITMRFLVPHSSHLTQPLDLGVFGQLKTLVRNKATYSIDLNAVDEAIAEEMEDEGNQRRPPAEKGKAMADYMKAILDAF